MLFPQKNTIENQSFTIIHFVLLLVQSALPILFIDIIKYLLFLEGYKSLVAKLSKDFLLKGCRMEAVAPTEEGYKRTAGTKVQPCFPVHSPCLLLQTLLPTFQTINYPPHVNNRNYFLYFGFIIFAAIEKSLKTASAG